MKRRDPMDPGRKIGKNLNKHLTNESKLISIWSVCLPPTTFETSELNKPTFLLGEIASPKWWKQLAKNVLEYFENGLCLKEGREGEVFKWIFAWRGLFSIALRRSSVQPWQTCIFSFSFRRKTHQGRMGKKAFSSLAFPFFPSCVCLQGHDVTSGCDLHFSLGPPVSLLPLNCLWISFNT